MDVKCRNGEKFEIFSNFFGQPCRIALADVDGSTQLDVIQPSPAEHPSDSFPTIRHCAPYKSVYYYYYY